MPRYTATLCLLEETYCKLIPVWTFDARDALEARRMAVGPDGIIPANFRSSCDVKESKK